MNYLDDINIIHQYIRGELEGQALIDFEKELGQNPELKEELALQRDLLSSIEAFGDLDLQNTLQEVEGKLEQEGFFVEEEQLQEYLLERSDKKLTELVERRLTQDPVLAEEKTLQEDLLKSIQYFGEQEELEVIGSVEQKLQQEGFFHQAKTVQMPVREAGEVKPPATRVGKRYLLRRLAVAATLLLLLAVGTFVLFPAGNNYDKIYANYYVSGHTDAKELVEELSVGFADAKNEQKANLRSALELYNNADYSQAVNTLREHIKSYPNDADARFFLGLSLLEIRAYEEACDVLDTIVQEGPSEHFYAAQWYQALSKLKARDGKAAKAMFQTIANDQRSPYQSMAREVLKEL